MRFYQKYIIPHHGFRDPISKFSFLLLAVIKTRLKVSKLSLHLFPLVFHVLFGLTKRSNLHVEF